ncbi:MAG: hypothetical protein WD886_07800 [Burkholderiales bacterium]
MHALQAERHWEFQRWFGGSRIVNDDGSPKIVFHGTRRGFAEFHCRRRTPELGFHFGTLSQAEFFAGHDGERRAPCGSNIRPVYLRIENPVRLPDLFERGGRSAENIARWMCRDGSIPQDVLGLVSRAGVVRQANEHIIYAIKGAGYDGIVYQNDWEGGSDTVNEDSYVVFEDDQIRSIFERYKHP